MLEQPFHLLAKKRHYENEFDDQSMDILIFRQDGVRYPKSITFAYLTRIQKSLKLPNRTYVTERNPIRNGKPTPRIYAKDTVRSIGFCGLSVTSTSHAKVENPQKSLEPEVTNEVDILVVGSGSAGTTAAIQ